VDTWAFQKEQRRQFESVLAHRSLAIEPAVAASGVIGLLDIPRLGLSVMVVEGTGTTALRRAAGHIPGTAQPGEPGNVGISAHRDTFFRPLRNIRQNDVITVNTPLAEYRYRVVSTRIVSPSDVTVLNPSGTEILTLVTCYPFYYVGSAPDRFIVRAERVRT
jgi:sortase A